MKPCIERLEDISRRNNYGVGLLQGCAPHQKTSQFFTGLAGDVHFVVKVPAMSVSLPEFAATAEDIAEEFAILKTMKHPNIIACADIPGLDGYHLTVKCNCTMSKIFNRNTFKNISDKHRQHALVGIAQGILFIASQGIVHGDISENNILFHKIPDFNEDSFSTPLITDFGYSSRLTKPEIEKVIDADCYDIQHGAGLQAIGGLAIYITDCFRFVWHVLLSVLGFSICKSVIGPRNVTVGGLVGPSRLRNPIYVAAMDQLMLISEITPVSSSIDPFQVPSNVPKFVEGVIRSRVICHAHMKSCYDGIVFTALEALVRFPRGDVKKSPESAWLNIIAAISDMSTWPAK